MYYGEEIGMENNDRKAKMKCKTPSASWAGAGKRKDSERTPMQWNDSATRASAR